MGPTFSTILNEFWTDFLQFSAKDGGCHTPPPAQLPPNVRPCACRITHVHFWPIEMLDWLFPHYTGQSIA